MLYPLAVWHFMKTREKENEEDYYEIIDRFADAAASD